GRLHAPHGTRRIRALPSRRHIRRRLEDSSPRDVFGDPGAVYERLTPEDRELFVLAFLGPREDSVHELRVRPRGIRGRWLYNDDNYKDGLFEPSLVGELHQKLGLAAAIARGFEGDAPPKGSHVIDLAVLVGTLAILGWLAFRVVARR